MWWLCCCVGFVLGWWRVFFELWFVVLLCWWCCLVWCRWVFVIWRFVVYGRCWILCICGCWWVGSWLLGLLNYLRLFCNDLFCVVGYLVIGWCVIVFVLFWYSCCVLVVGSCSIGLLFGYWDGRSLGWRLVCCCWGSWFGKLDFLVGVWVCVIW